MAQSVIQATKFKLLKFGGSCRCYLNEDGGGQAVGPSLTKITLKLLELKAGFQLLSFYKEEVVFGQMANHHCTTFELAPTEQINKQLS